LSISASFTHTHHRDQGTGTARNQDGYIAAGPASVIGSFLSDTEPNMTKATMLFCAAASAVTFYAAPAGAAPLSTPLALNSAETQNTEAVRYHRRHGRAYYGSRYNSFAFAPGYVGRRYGGFRRGGHTCSRDQDEEYSAYPSWWCSRIRNYQ
jgi:hypothetical protein